MTKARGLWAQGYVAQLLSLIANIMRDEKKKSTPYEPKDFMPPKRKRRGKANDAAIDAWLNQFPQGGKHGG